jgi:glycerol-3-phosphate dehydrogenase subunit B
MKFQTIIIGGGLSGLIAGIKLSEAGQKVAIISSGQSALHFSSGSFELLGNLNGEAVTTPLEAIKNLPAKHPYSKIGSDIEKYINEVKPLMAKAGIELNGSAAANHYRLTPLGKVKSAWLTESDFLTLQACGEFPYKKVALFNLAGFLDFYPQFLSLGLSALGVESRPYVLTAPLFDKLRKSSTEMRAPNIARVLDHNTLDILGEQINQKAVDADVVLLPAIFGAKDSEAIKYLRSIVKKPLYCISTIPISVPGMRMQYQLRSYFSKLGGVYMLGDNVNGGKIENSQLQYITTVNHEDEKFYADNYILASGSFVGHGIVSNYDTVSEPVFGLDVEDNVPFAQRSDIDMYKSQPFMSYGVVTDAQFKACQNGKTVNNLYAAGSVIGGCNPMEEGCGAGVAILTALKVVSNILND